MQNGCLPTIDPASVARFRSNPKTVLGFYGTALGIVDFACVAASVGLGETRTDTWLIPLILGFAALFTVALIVAVFIVNLRDPSRLMLGEVRAAEFIQLHARLGDSLAGDQERIVEVPSLPSGKPSTETNAISGEGTK